MTIKVQWHRLGLAAIDALLVAIALYAGYMLRFEFHISPEDQRQYLFVAPALVIVRLICFALFWLYRGLLRYASTTELYTIFVSTTLGTAILSFANLFIAPMLPAIKGLPEFHGHLQRLPWSIVVIEFLITLLLIGGAHFSRRVLVFKWFRREAPGTQRRVLVVGAGDAGEAVARQLLTTEGSPYTPVAFVDDDSNKSGLRIHGLPVAGTTEDLGRHIEHHKADEVLIALEKAEPEHLRQLLELCRDVHVGFKIVPSVNDLLAGRVSINQIRPVEIEDLLGRDPVRLELAPGENYVDDQVVMVTGAGGSIGSELCRQLLNLNPKRIVLYGHGENSIYDISSELSVHVDAGILAPVIGDIRDNGKLRSTIARYKPTIFFHAAAHKHVPLMEAHPDEAVKNNIIGTRNVAEAAREAGAHKFILISSDKAVRPTNVMGATKRVAEMMIFCMARKTPAPQFTAVRFGNVLGSRGSVIPLFRRQIAAGGPVTITHRDIVRYFMTIPEAVSLVIRAGSSPEQRRLFILDMGEPVKIVDLARNLIRLSGFEPEKEIPIVFTGLRPGEKLIEELLTEGEGVQHTDIGKVLSAVPDRVDCETLWKTVEELETAANQQDHEAIRRHLQRIVPDYHPAAHTGKTPTGTPTI